jgi:hypothetical protein
MDLSSIDHIATIDHRPWHTSSSIIGTSNTSEHLIITRITTPYSMTHPIVRILLLWSFLPTFNVVVGFQPVTTTRPSFSVTSLHQVATTTANAEYAEYAVEVVEGGEDDPRVLDIASFRNGMVNPEMMVERAQTKRDAIDTTAAAVDGLKIGALYIGPVIGALTFLESNDVIKAVSNYVLLGGGIGVLLAANNYMGRGIHVPEIPEATK